MGEISTPAMLGIAAAAYYFLVYKPQTTGTPSPVTTLLNPATTAAANTYTQPLTTAPVTQVSQPVQAAPVTPVLQTTYPYLIAGAPLPLPNGFNQQYYITYVYPAMLAQNPNVGNSKYTLTETDATNYANNYVDISQWLTSFKTGTPYQHLNYHWQTYGAAEQRTFLPLWSYNPASWVPPPPAKNSSGIFSDILKVATVVGAGVAEVASGGTLTPIVAPAASAALAAESSIHGTSNLPAIGDNEAEILFTGAAILIDILPFYNQVNKRTVKAVNNKLFSLLNQYS